MNDSDLQLLRQAIDVARRAREHGNHPFGALLADEQGNVLLEAGNSIPYVGSFGERCGNIAPGLRAESSYSFLIHPAADF